MKKSTNWSETPPLARRKLAAKEHVTPTIGNTSACAEKTDVVSTSDTLNGKHLRLRGENAKSSGRSNGEQETPPLARRKLWSLGRIKLTMRNTSACAEKTACEPQKRGAWQKHLRLRGENCLSPGLLPLLMETPPLARRKRIASTNTVLRDRNTSACAEKTLARSQVARSIRKHLRLRGENSLVN